MPQKLTKQELKVSLMLSNGVSYKTISERLGVSMSTVYNHTHSLRKKTGVTSTRSAEQAATLYTASKITHPTITPIQAKVLRLYTDRLTHGEIAERLGISKNCSSVHLFNGCHKLNITDKKRAAKIKSIKLKLGIGPVPAHILNTMDDPAFN